MEKTQALGSMLIALLHAVKFFCFSFNCFHSVISVVYATLFLLAVSGRHRYLKWGILKALMTTRDHSTICGSQGVGKG